MDCADEKHVTSSAAEIMPLSFRAKGTSLSTATNWLFNWIVGEGTPILQETIQWRLYPMHAFFCVCSFIVVYLYYPETMGVPLEEMDALFGDEGTIVPQGDGDDGEDEEAEENGIERPIRRSISSHPRFMSSEERAARAAAAKVAAAERERARSFFGINPRGWLGRLMGTNASGPDRRLYETLRRDDDDQ